MSDELEKFHVRQLAADPQYAIARQLLDLGDAIAQLRERAGMTRGQLGKRLGVKAWDIAIAEEETPRAPAGLVEEALSLLVQTLTPSMQRQSEVSISLRTIRHLRPALVPA
jgi:transcriptional regulator with XRE-family HTH domain